jgi:Lrp/AsnC family leucine-responsive transcriptional regulator
LSIIDLLNVLTKAWAKYAKPAGRLQRKKQAKLDFCLFAWVVSRQLPNPELRHDRRYRPDPHQRPDGGPRRSLKALAQISGLSSPSVAERLRRLEERGVLKGYTVEIDPKCFGYQLGHRPGAPCRGNCRKWNADPVDSGIHRVRQVRRGLLHRRLHVRSMEQLDTLLDRLNTLAETNTAIVKKTPSAQVAADGVSAFAVFGVG